MGSPQTVDHTVDHFSPSRRLPPLPRADTRPPGAINSDERADRTRSLLQRAHDCADEAARRRLIDEVVELNLGVARAIASRYRKKGADFDDLVQVASLGLVKAANGFSPEVSSDFLAYAVPTISGEVKRHFRDFAWVIRPTRRIQELQGAIAGVEPELTQRLGRSPRVSEVAAALGVEEEAMVEALAADGCFSPTSLDSTGPSEESTPLAEMLGEDDHQYQEVEHRETLAPILAAMPARDRRIIELRFFHGRTQEQIGRELGVSQMQISRLLSAILGRMREQLAT